MAPRQKKSAVDKAMGALERALEKQYEQANAIEQSGTKLILPEYMDIPDAVKMLQTHLDEMENELEKSTKITCHPDDGLSALNLAIVNSFGNLVGKESFGFFSMIPAREKVITIGYDQTVSVPVGRVEIPGIGNKLSLHIAYGEDERSPMDGYVELSIYYKKKYEPLADSIVREWRRLLRYHSIFKGAAIDSAFNFLPTKDSDTSFIVYTDDEQRALNANLFMPIERRADLPKIGEKFRRTVLLHGKFGTGKTLTALLVAKIAEEHGVTFIKVRSGDPIAPSLKFAKKFQPCVVFFEDVDSEAAVERDAALNVVLERLDGLLSKDADVLTVLTTNNLDELHRAMLRPGRIDDVLELGKITPGSMVRLVEAYGSGLIDGDLNGQELWEAALGDTDMPYVPAFVTEAVKRSKRWALADSGNATITITQQNVVDSLLSLRTQWDMMNSDRKVKRMETLDAAFAEILTDMSDDMQEGVQETLKEQILDKLQCLNT